MPFTRQTRCGRAKADSKDLASKLGQAALGATVTAVVVFAVLLATTRPMPTGLVLVRYLGLFSLVGGIGSLTITNLWNYLRAEIREDRDELKYLRYENGVLLADYSERTKALAESLARARQLLSERPSAGDLMEVWMARSKVEFDQYLKDTLWPLLTLNEQDSISAVRGNNETIPGTFDVRQRMKLSEIEGKRKIINEIMAGDERGKAANDMAVLKKLSTRPLA